jgi:dihydroorotase
MRIHIKNGRLIDPKNGVDALRDLYITDGRVSAVGAPPNGFAADQTIDAAGCVVAPGLVDIAARLREPGSEHKATLETELSAAVAGGVTSVACLPDTDPPLDEPGLVEMLNYRAHKLNLARIHPLGAFTAGLAGERLTEMAKLREAGCVAFTQADRALLDTQVLYRGLQYAATFGFGVWLRAQDPHLSRNGVAHDGEVATRLGLPPIPAVAETIALDAILRLVRQTGARVHICRLSAAESVEMIRNAKRDRLPITCDVSIHHLHLADTDIGYFNSMCHLAPPLRGVRDRDALRAGLADGTIDAACSDHTPLDDDQKQLPFGESSPGATGLELLLSLTLKWASEMNVSLPSALARVTIEPARILDIDAGSLGVGEPADVVVFDPRIHTLIEASGLKSQGKNTPFLGLELPGSVRHTLVGGRVVYTAAGL